ncbi:4428_t:CDS:2 [Cetraspora pellucida]|uniref:4428_t:CDS:1 n=1 Tax=Cetraspora pellucida TaxID=1433469 RepID=A0A9N9D5B3_9GLOM|nr:4428_t:CDS:2 [Cetraspora pellucida]
MSNKCNINKQILQRLLVELYEHDEESITEILEGLHHLAPALNDYFKVIPSMLEKNIEKSEATLILYESFALSNEEQVKTLKNYYNALMFNDIAISIDSEQKLKICDGYCFTKVLLLIHLIFKNTSTFNLALVHWYDFKHPNILQNFINSSALIYN